MTITELIARLSSYPGNAIVSAETADGTFSLITALTDVGLATGKGSIILRTDRAVPGERMPAMGGGDTATAGTRAQRAARRIAWAMFWVIMAGTAAFALVPRFFPWTAYWATAVPAILAGTCARDYLRRTGAKLFPERMPR